MTDENSTLRHEFNQLKIETEANMKILEANFEKSSAANREAISEMKTAFAKLLAAFERLRASIEQRDKFMMVFIVGVAVAVAEYVFGGGIPPAG